MTRWPRWNFRLTWHHWGLNSGLKVKSSEPLPPSYGSTPFHEMEQWQYIFHLINITCYKDFDFPSLQNKNQIVGIKQAFSFIAEQTAIFVSTNKWSNSVATGKNLTRVKEFSLWNTWCLPRLCFEQLSAILQTMYFDSIFLIQGNKRRALFYIFCNPL